MILATGIPTGFTPALAESANSLARKGNDYYKHERYQQAAEAYRQALTLDPTSPVIQYNLGTALARQGQGNEARQALTQAAEVPGAPTRRDAFFNLGVTLGESAKQPPGGVSGPAQGGSPEAGGGIKEETERLEQSLVAFRQAILTDPKDDEAKYNYEVVQEMLRRLRQEQQEENPGRQQKNENQTKQDQSKQDSQQQQNQNKQEQKSDQSKDQQGGEQQNQDSDRKGGLEAQPTPQPASKSNDQTQSAESGQKNGGADQEQKAQGEPMKPEQMDALRLLNLLESEKPEQFKDLFRFQGQKDRQPPEKDW